MELILITAPLFLIFEAWQLVMGERYLGLKQIARNGDPRTLGLAEWVAFCWTTLILAYLLWMLSLLAIPYARVYGVALVAVSAAGFSLRRNAGLKWVLVILTLEGAVRVGLLVSLVAMAWRRH